MAGLLISDEGSRVEWLVSGREGGFGAYYRVTRIDRSVEAEGFSKTMKSREDAVSWLKGAARARGFDARGIR